MYEDCIFNFDVFRCHPRLIVVSSSVNRYEQYNGGSIMRTLNKEKVLVQLNDLYYNILSMHYYIESDKSLDMLPAALRCIKIFLRGFSNKLIRISLTRDEWQRYTRLLRPADISMMDYSKYPSLLGRVIQWLKKNSLRSFFIYRLSYLLSTYVFEGGLKKLIVRH